jgi:ssDNA-binding Zn-finger/Zn-ribbon topoisomerase 1
MADAPYRNDGVTMPAAPATRPTVPCPRCGQRFTPVGRQRFCSPACRQAAWRRRHPAPVPALPARTPRPATVYECPGCGARLLGEQRCPDCNVFCRRLGLGGRCPHCDEPVALADLLGPTAPGASAAP